MQSIPQNHWENLNRREFLARYAGGIGSIALTSLLAEEALGEDDPPHIPKKRLSYDLDTRQPHFEPSAKAVISLFMHGGPSHMDLMDPKPELTKRHGQDYAKKIRYSFQNRATRKLFGSPFKFEHHGECGTELSELLPHTARIVDDIALIRSMYIGINGHEPSIWSMNTGLPKPGRPAMGSWVTYALGSRSRDLPAYVVLTDPGGLPVDGVRNWSQGWLPPIYQGTPIRPREPRILNLSPHADLRGRPQEEQLSLLDKLNQKFARRLGGNDQLEARIRSYELAARMQVAATEALDLGSEPASVKKMYGLDRKESRSYGERCLLARRLVERGVRYVQILINNQIWDNHNDLRGALRGCCARTDQPSAALVRDLKQRGLLDSTLVVWGGEIGRLPVIENHGNPKKAGRDHNGQGFSTWMAGGGIKGGQVYGETDEFGHKAVVDRVGPADFHATVLHLLGLDSKKVSYFHGGKYEMLTDNGKGRVIDEVLRNPPSSA